MCADSSLCDRFIPKVELLIGGANTLGQIIVGVSFCRMSWGFVSFTLGAMQRSQAALRKKDEEEKKKKKNTKEEQLMRLAKWLFVSGVGMFWYVFVVVFIVLSGKRIYGMYDPLGHLLIWGGGRCPWALPYLGKPNHGQQALNLEEGSSFCRSSRLRFYFVA